MGSTRNANRVLKELGEWVHRERLDNETVYYLSDYGCKWLGVDKKFKRTNMLRHTIMRNDLYIYYEQPEDWEIEKPLEYVAEEKQGIMVMRKNRVIVPDARFTKEGYRYYVEVDNERHMSDNLKKIKEYSSMKGIYERERGKPFKLIFYTRSLHRQNQLMEWMKEHKLSGNVFTSLDIK